MNACIYTHTHNYIYIIYIYIYIYMYVNVCNCHFLIWMLHDFDHIAEFEGYNKSDFPSVKGSRTNQIKPIRSIYIPLLCSIVR